MAGDPPKIIQVDDDWKAQARKEKERLAEQVGARDEIPPASFAEVLNLITMQALVGLGMMAAPGGQRIPADLPVAKHFIDLLGVLEEKTRNNLTAEEKQMLDQLLHELRLQFVAISSGGAGPVPAPRISPES